ncbi:DUF29 domain-containing protein [Aureimonas sp. D3]|uniref:DUF29 domain-containing protein n=1 Tax=Aureimonas sp. D3 TaxID=1638164 RepID=UPI000AE464A1|nr:DUF29 domain-containing protein [Aureimonas sp. D3]
MAQPKEKQDMGPVFQTGGTSRSRAGRPTLYDRDFFLWTRQQAQLLRERSADASGLDTTRLAEEIEDLGSSQQSEIENRLCVLLAHLLKWQFQPSKRSNSWRATIAEQRMRIARRLRQSPSLRSYPAEVLEEEYALARLSAVAETNMALETFPLSCPFGIDDILDPDFFPGVD